MKVAIGEGCEKKSWQDPFEKQTECVYCGGNAELAFVAYEGLDGEDIDDPTLLYRLQEQTSKPGDLGLHDCCAVAVYFCRNCVKPTAEYNQG